MGKLKIQHTEVEIEGREIRFAYGNGPFITFFQSYARLLATDQGLTGADLRIIMYILATINRSNTFCLNRAEAATNMHINESTISKSIKKLLARRIIIKTGKRKGVYTLSEDILKLNDRVACKVSADQYLASRSPLILNIEGTSALFPLTKSGFYTLQQFQPDGSLPAHSEFGPNYDFNSMEEQNGI